jgi:hypothetical protein
MGRGAEAKSERKLKRKEARFSSVGQNSSALELDLDNEFDTPYIPPNTSEKSNSDEEEKEGEVEEELDLDKLDKDKIAQRIKKGQKKRATAAEGSSTKSASEGIKTTPLILLILLTGTTLLPALLYAGSWVGGALQKPNFLRSLGYKLGVGPSPRKRVMSFYEKHDPSKLNSVPTILSQYYGDYPKLIKRLERKYGDYGYFSQWENDETPMKVVSEKLEEGAVYLQKIFNAYAPRIVKNGVRNARYNLGFLYKKASRIWKKKIWPILEPFFGVPKGAERQKRQDAQDAARKRRGKRNTEFRDEDEF